MDAIKLMRAAKEYYEVLKEEKGGNHAHSLVAQAWKTYLSTKEKYYMSNPLKNQMPQANRRSNSEPRLRTSAGRNHGAEQSTQRNPPQFNCICARKTKNIQLNQQIQRAYDHYMHLKQYSSMDPITEEKFNLQEASCKLRYLKFLRWKLDGKKGPEPPLKEEEKKIIKVSSLEGHTDYRYKHEIPQYQPSNIKSEQVKTEFGRPSKVRVCLQFS